MNHTHAAPLVLASLQWPVQVYYDASCRLCAAEMTNLRVRDLQQRLRFVDCSAPDFASGPVGRADLMQAMHCQDAGGRVFSGVDAFRVLYHAVGLDPVQRALAHPLLGGLSRRLYPWVARYRQRLPAWLIAPLFERAARRAALAAAQRSQTCSAGRCELPPHTPDPAQTTALASLAPEPASPGVTASATPPDGHGADHPRTILVTGASGFIGRHIAAALRARGHHVIGASRSSRPACPFSQMTQPQAWRPWLSDPASGQPVDLVINAVGALRDRPGRSLQALHADAPRALFTACAQAGVRRVVQVSALGIADNDTAYARTKRDADAHLLGLTAAGQLDGLVLRPSLVFGRGGQSSALFMALARLPVLPLPRAAHTQPIQPLAVAELAEAVVRLALGEAWPAPFAAPGSPATGLLALGGARALSMADFIASLRAQLGLPPARQLVQPEWFSQVTAWLGDVVPVSPWCSASWTLMRTPNATASGALQAALGRAPTPPEALLPSWRTPVAPVDQGATR
ncbi:DCC1-like thiol-disulfide oxidoreductase family protein [Comamonas serinivorans]|nr:DCC1-like thiol-disulfide oxidoreductase family protein [Comamonas serinivorans]